MRKIHRYMAMGAVASVSLLAGGRVARAQDAAPSPPAPGAAARAVEPPAIVEFVEAEYPAEARAQRREGRVVLRLSIDVEGRVTNAAIAEGAGYGFDEAARAAAVRWRFSPARRAGTPVAVRISYPYEFRLPAERPAPAVEPSAPAPEAPAPEAPAPEAPTNPPAPEKGVTEVTVRGKSESDRLRQSAQAVHVIDTEQAKLQTADLGEVLARSQGIGVQRSGGLGSEMRLSLNGLADDQIRFFLDGVPLEIAGYPFGVVNVPVNLVQRVEVYRGVVPARFGADALGGAVNLVSERNQRGTHAQASYQVGSFGTHRLTLGANHLDEPSGFFARAGGFYDYAKNDYPVDVDNASLDGRLTPVRVDRFHDAYRAAGGHVEVGFVDRPWAKSLRLRVFVTDFGKDLQHNVVMTGAPYGGADYGALAAGASLRYENVFATRAGRFSIDALGGYTFGRRYLNDVDACIYDWFGQCTGQNPKGAGQIEPGRPRDQVLRDHTVFARVNLGWRPRAGHELRASLSPTCTTRRGEEGRPIDPNRPEAITAKQTLVSLVSALEYQVDLFDGRLSNIAFVKNYLQWKRAQELVGGALLPSEQDLHRFGVGDALRYRFVDWLYAKASYEWSTRLPRPDEVFGNGALVRANLNLQPESSHNANLGLTLDARKTAAGDVRLDVNGFLRETSDFISILGEPRGYTYQNITNVRSVGVQAAAGWTSPGEYLALDGNTTYANLRNNSREGAYGAYEGDRIPNRPYFLANGTARFQLRDVRRPGDELSLTWNVRYVHSFYRDWESAGVVELKPVVPAQTVHAAALTYIVRDEDRSVSFTGEIDNVTDEKAFDFYGVERPGRAYFFKMTANF